MAENYYHIIQRKAEVRSRVAKLIANDRDLFKHVEFAELKAVIVNLLIGLVLGFAIGFTAHK